MPPATATVLAISASMIRNAGSLNGLKSGFIGDPPYLPMPRGVICYSQPECLATYNAFSFMGTSRPIASRIGPPCERAFEQLDAAMSNMIDFYRSEVRSPDCYCMRETNQPRQYHLDLSL